MHKAMIEDRNKRDLQRKTRRLAKAKGIKYTTALRELEAIVWHEPIDCDWGCAWHLYDHKNPNKEK